MDVEEQIDYVRDKVLVRIKYDYSIVAFMTERGQDSADLGLKRQTSDEVMDVLACKTQTVHRYGKLEV